MCQMASQRYKRGKLFTLKNGFKSNSKAIGNVDIYKAPNCEKAFKVMEEKVLTFLL